MTLDSEAGDDMPLFGNADRPGSEAELKAARDWFRRKVAQGAAAAAQGKLHTDQVMISPAMAYVMLQHNPLEENRKLSAEIVDKYVKDMTGGKYEGLNGVPIIVSRCGYLNDGQHRLHAIIQVGGYITLSVTFGPTRESRLTVDQGKVKTSGDYFTMSGIKNGNNVAAIATVLYLYETDSFSNAKDGRAVGSDKRPTKRFLHDYALEHLEDIERGLTLVMNTGGRRLSTPSRLAAALILIARAANWDDAEMFMRALIEGVGMSKTNPIYVARERLLGERTIGVVRVTRTLEVIFRGWNACRRGKRLKKICLTGELPAIED
jgi:hypothetical protein